MGFAFASPNLTGMGKKIDLVGVRQGKLLVIGSTEERVQGSIGWVCRCDCGTECTISSRRILHRNKTSCGKCEDKRRQLPPGESGFRKLYGKYVHDASKIGREFLLTKDEFRTLTSGNCWYCGDAPHKLCNPGGCSGYSSYRYNGVDRQNTSIGYLTGNCVTCCFVCNVAKHTMSLEDFLRWISKISKNTVDRRALLV